MFKKTGIPFSDFIAAYTELDYGWLALGILLFFISHMMRTVRWQMQLEATNEKATFKATFSAMMAGYLMNYGIPRSGEVIKCGLLAKHQNIPVSKVAGTAVADRIIDVVLLLIAIGVAFILQFDLLYNYLKENANFTFDYAKLGILVALFIALVIGFFLIRKKLEKYPIYKKIVSLLVGFKDGLLSIKDLKKPSLYILLSLSVWICYILMNYAALKSFGPTTHLSISQALLIFIFGSLGIIIPTPGGIGSFQFFTQQAIMLFGISADNGFIAGNIMFWPFVLANIILGGIGFFYISRNIIPDESTADKE